MNLTQLFAMLLVLRVGTVHAQKMGINTPGDPHTSAMFEIHSTNRGFLPPRMTRSQRESIATPAEGLTVYDLTYKTLFVYNGSLWQPLQPGSINNLIPYGEWKTYYIAKGTFDATNISYTPVSQPHVVFTARFDTSAIYTTQSSANQGNVNKLYGFSDCNSFHQHNSARVGWRWFGNQLELYAYSYANGAVTATLLQAVSVNQAIVCEISSTTSQYVFKVNNVERARTPRGCTLTTINGYRLFPYFGGSEPAPKNVQIGILNP
jgi:hypothetical protein